MAANPIIAILGTTGVGKSSLGVELALYLTKMARASGWQGARVINADSMQVYSGMDIITNKISMADRRGVEHLLMDVKKPGEQYIIGEWIDDALTLIKETHQQRRIPIIVGGTSYWIQHLIFPNRLVSETYKGPCEPSPRLQACLVSLSQDLLHTYNNLPERPPSASLDPEAASKLHGLLRYLDVEIAQRWHWKDTRKVLRSLAIIKETGRLPSEIINSQSRNLNADAPRFESLCFWLYAEPSALEQRLYDRVDTMVQQGLLQEVQTLRDSCQASRMHPDDSSDERQIDFTTGIYQAIGFKEFSRYLSLSTPTSKDFGQAVERMKISTRQYAKRQISWIRNKFLPAVYGSKFNSIPARWPTPIFLLDATNLDDGWKTNVLEPAFTLMEDFLAGNELAEPVSLSKAAERMLACHVRDISPSVLLTDRRKTICDLCTVNEEQPFMVEEGREWELHIRSHVHRRWARGSTTQVGDSKISSPKA